MAFPLFLHAPITQHSSHTHTHPRAVGAVSAAERRRCYSVRSLMYILHIDRGERRCMGKARRGEQAGRTPEPQVHSGEALAEEHRPGPCQNGRAGASRRPMGSANLGKHCAGWGRTGCGRPGLHRPFAPFAGLGRGESVGATQRCLRYRRQRAASSVWQGGPFARQPRRPTGTRSGGDRGQGAAASSTKA